MHADQLDAATVVRCHGRIGAAARRLEHVHAVGLVQCQRAVVGSADPAHRRERAVALAAHPQQLHAVLCLGRNHGVRAVSILASHRKHVHAAGAAQQQRGIVQNRVGIHERAVFEHADQVRAARPGVRSGNGVRAVAQIEGVDAQGPRWAGAATRGGRKVAVVVHADQLDAFVPPCRDRVCAVAHVEHVDVDGGGEVQRGVVAERADRLERAAVAHADQLNAVLVGRDDRGVRGAAHAKDCNAVRAAEPPASAILKAVGRAQHGLRPASDLNVAPAGQRASRPRGGQGQVCGVASRITDRRAVAKGEGIGAGIVQVGRLVARLHHVQERQLVRVAAAGVRGAARRLGCKQHRRTSRDDYRLVKGHGDVDCMSSAVRAVGARRCDAHGRRSLGVDQYVAGMA